MKQSRKGLLLVISGPAGVGKGTINLSLISRNSDIRMSVSATTRQPRPGEIDGVHYFFKTEEEFRKMIESGAFLEYMRVFNTHYYGTPKSFVEQELAEGRSVILEIDVQGDLAGILTISTQSKNPAAGATGLQVKMVAGAGFEPAAFRL